jgi:uncharacterized membrane protein
MTVGIIWINHHVLVSRLRAVDHAFMLLNLLLLMSVAVLPFATNLMATYPRAGHGENLAAVIYGGALFVMGALFGVLNIHILHRRSELLRHPVAPAERRRIIVRNLSGVAPYLIATLLAPLTPYAVLVISGAVAIFYALPIAIDEDDAEPAGEPPTYSGGA